MNLLSCSKFVTFHSEDNKTPVKTYSHHKGYISSVNINYLSRMPLIQIEYGPVVAKMEK